MATGRITSLYLWLDVGERGLIFLFYGILLVRLWGAYKITGVPVYLILVVAEGFVPVFALMRKTTDRVSLKLSDWSFALAGSLLPLLATPGGAALAPVNLAGGIMLFGLLLQVWAKLSLNRSFGLVAANRGVKIRGPYVFVRHPMYLGYTITHVGFLLFNLSLWNLFLYACELVLQIKRLQAEERLLQQDTTYQAYSAEVRHRFLPGLY